MITFNKIKSGLLLFLSLAILTNFALSLKKQWVSQRQVSLNMAKKQAELRQLEEENRNFQARLKETEEPGFADKEAAKLLGMAKDNGPKTTPKEKETEKEAVYIPEIPNYQKWFKLFVY